MDQGTKGQRKAIHAEVAEEIAADLRGAAYYKDPKILADFLKGRLSLSESKAVEVANAVVADLRGAGYYKDPAILADFLKGAKDST